MVNRLIQAMIAIVIGLALLPVVAGFAESLTTDGGETGDPGALFDTPAGALVDLLPVLYVIVLVAGVVGFIYTSRN